jgi:TPR repeat protein
MGFLPIIAIWNLDTSLRATKAFVNTNLQSHPPGREDDFVEMSRQIEGVAQDLWQVQAIPTMPLPQTVNGQPFALQEGEAKLPKDIPYSQRAEFFRKEANKGCPKAQHSLALLLWSGFGGANRNAEESAKFHAAAARQNHLDGMAVLGGCLRTGTGVKRNITLGLQLIEFSANNGNPTGVNKKAALLESDDDYYGAFDLYNSCYESSSVNALMLFNLGWCLYNAQGVDEKNAEKGMQLWKDASQMAPDEGSEEAAWYIYNDLKRENPKAAEVWLDLAVELGLDEAIAEKASIPEW